MGLIKTGYEQIRLHAKKSLRHVKKIESAGNISVIIGSVMLVPHAKTHKHENAM